MGRLLERQPMVLDTLLALLLAVAAVVIILSAEDTFSPEMTMPSGPLQWAVAAGAAWAIPFRRVAPITAMSAGALLQATVWSFAFPDTYIAMAVLLFSAAAHGSRSRRGWVWVAVAGLTLYIGLGVLASDAPLYALPLIGLFSVAAASVGSTIAARQETTVAAQARARDLERSRQADQDRAVVEERARIARELHDVVAHGLSVIVVQASAARRIIERDPDGAASALQQIETTGRNALGEMRHVLAAIRTEPDESWEPARSLADLDALVAELGRAGLGVTVRRDPPTADTPTADGPDGGYGAGDHDQPGGEPELPATVDVTAYRIVQESLTNVLKHGGDGASATVEIVRHPHTLDLRIVDDGRGVMAADLGGHGLRGMRERVDVFGGRFRAGPRMGGGFVVEVSLPFDGHHDSGRAAPTATGR